MRLSKRTYGLIAVVTILAAFIFLVTAVREHRARNRLMRMDPERVLDDPSLTRAALSIGRRGFEDHCASCHRAGQGDPARGVPDLTDQDFLYGTGKVEEIEQIVLHGIRSGDPKGWNLASMPAYARAKPYAAEPVPSLMPGQISDVTQYLLLKHGAATDPAAATRGETIYKRTAGCYDCHGPDAGGDDAIGAPNLLDDIWLYGDGSAAAIARSIAQGRAGVSPAFARVLSPSDARAIAIYTASLSRRGSHD